ncbi:MAG: flippase-like domain-containing protein [Bacilli bacterium]|nr:flippase-like domain-containing protein [Bacilli bacterium]
MKKMKINIILLVLVAFIVLFFSLKDNFFSVIDYLRSINYFWIIIACGFYVLNILFQSLAQYSFLKEVNSDYKKTSCFKLMSIAMFFNGITPFSSGGQPFEIYLLRKENIKVSDSANALLQNFITYQFALIFIGTVALLTNVYLDIIPDDMLLRKIVIIGYLINVSVMALIIFLSRGKKTNTKIFNKIFNFIFKLRFIKNGEQKRQKAEKMLDDFYNSTAIMKNNFKNTVKSFLFNLLSLLCLYIIPLFIYLSLDNHEMTIVNSLVLSGYTFLIGSFVPIPGGSGGLEYAYTTFFGIFYSGGLLSASMLLWRLITYYLGIIIGGITLVTYRKKE